jgi:hypothetical protein
MSGWIKLHRSIKEWEWYGDTNVRLTFLHCLVEANFKDQSYRGIMIKRGSFPCGRVKFAEEVGISVQQLRTSFSKLESTGEINQQSTSKGTIVTVCNYESYQGGATSDQPANQQADNKPSTNHQPLTKKGIKEEGENNKNTPEQSEKPKFVPPTIEEFIAYLKTALPKMNPDWQPEQIQRAATCQFDTYQEQGWKDGNGKPIKIWKTKAKNAMSYKKPWNFGTSSKSDGISSTIPQIDVLNNSAPAGWENQYKALYERTAPLHWHVVAASKQIEIKQTLGN